MSTLSMFEVSFTNLSYEYFALPASYPIQPYNDQELQPATYNQIKDQAGYITILLPLSGNLGVSLPDTLEISTDDKDVVYHLNLILNHEESLDENGRLAMISLSVDFPEDVSTEGKWQVMVSAPADAGGEFRMFSNKRGKVMMDSNIMPA
ncbi:hypothetical protein [Chitinophaga sancti]|uniref:Uncharacterized protein n=1 Tax=Chitinophaga sancti TaxID=1004 RepID=A0A1K1R6I6_9BACT|nr:hypothetical protein [Chitinophaga sancti]WQD64170.1 hypothetical protein U0033_07165 [Chitinophaga sancti]WQG90206.1 hypothetical protein SR876_01755 [Chitinophaga sancti]SFW67767.1 hypothetical protein SAMN05661012_03476 [Chitinophaga sancti]